MDQLVEEFGIPCPNYIKIDVPAMTEAIMTGGARTLQRADVRELHVEASEKSKGGRRLVEILGQYGFGIAARHVRKDTTDFISPRRLPPSRRWPPAERARDQSGLRFVVERMLQRARVRGG
jgi:hypothetical protein